MLNTLKFKFKRAALSLFKKKPMSKNETSRVIKSPTKIVKPCYWKSLNLLCNFIQITNFFRVWRNKTETLDRFFSRGIAEVTDFFLSRRRSQVMSTCIVFYVGIRSGILDYDPIADRLDGHVIHVDDKAWWIWLKGINFSIWYVRIKGGGGG